MGITAEGFATGTTTMPAASILKTADAALLARTALFATIVFSICPANGTGTQSRKIPGVAATAVGWSIATASDAPVAPRPDTSSIQTSSATGLPATLALQLSFCIFLAFGGSHHRKSNCN